MNKLSDVIKSGGGTYNQDGSIATHKEGYYVGGVDEVQLYINDNPPIYNDVPVNEIIDDILDFTLSYPTHNDDSYNLAGFWVNDGKLYIERVKHTVNLSYALSCGKANKQQCIWDIVNSDTIPITNQHR